MAASMTKHAGSLAGRQFCLINRLKCKTTCPTHIFLSRSIPSLRNIHHTTSDTIVELQKDQDNIDISSAGTANQNRHSISSQGQQSTLAPENDEIVKDHIPLGVSNMRKNLREHHKLSGYDRLGSINWESEYDDPQYTAISSKSTQFVPGKFNTTEMSGTHEEDFFGVFEELDNKHAESNSVSAKHIAHSQKDEVKKRGSHPTKTFEHILRNKVSPTKVETVVELPYGIMRRDQDNIVRSHGRVHAVHRKSVDMRPSESTNVIDTQQEIDSKLEPTIQTQDNYFDEQYFQSSTPKEHPSMSIETSDENLSRGDRISSNETQINNQENDFEEQYFAHEHVAEEKQTQTQSQNDLKDTGPSFIENQYFENGTDADLNPTPVRGEDLGRFSEFVQDVTESGPTTVSFQQTIGKRERMTIQRSSPTSKDMQKPRKVSPQDNTHSSSEYDKGHSFSEKSTPGTNLFDEQYFTEGMKGHVPEGMGTTMDRGDHEFDDQYFGKLDSAPMMSQSEINVPSNQPDEDVFGNKHFSKVSSKKETSEDQYFPHGSPKQPHDRVILQESSERVDTYRSEKLENTTRMSRKLKQDSNETLHNDDPDFGSNDVHVGGHTKQQTRVQSRIKPNLENPETAYDLAMKLRLEKKGRIRADDAYTAPNAHKWSGAVDSKGFRKLKDQVPDIQRMPQEVVVSILCDSILYEADEFLAIDKPYGLPSHGGPGVHHSIGKLMRQLAEKIGTKELDLVHRLDKETTGVMLLAKTTNMGVKLRRMFKEREVIKRYWMITKGIPSPLSGTIDIPMVEDEVGGRYRMNVQPYKTEQTNVLIRKQQLDLPRKDAVTKYKVLDSNNGAALVECEPETGVKHQIRCHLAFGMNTPVLGDHKYSHYTKMAPQRLSPEILKRLGLRQALVRYVPMHLHAKALVLPQLGSDGRNIFISCRLPKHFVQNMAWLKLKPPKGV